MCIRDRAAAEQGAQGGTAAETDWHTPFSEMEFAPSLQANQDALDSLKPVTQSIATKLENVSAQLNGLRTMNPMYITNIAEHNQSRQALEEQQAALSEQLKQAQAAEQTMRQAYQEATKTPADLLCEQYQNQRQAVAQARKDGLSQAEIAQLEAQMNETYQSYLAAWNDCLLYTSDVYKRQGLGFRKTATCWPARFWSAACRLGCANWQRCRWGRTFTTSRKGN